MSKAEELLESLTREVVSKGKIVDFDVAVLVPVHKKLMAEGLSCDDATRLIEGTVLVWTENGLYVREGVTPRGKLTEKGYEHFSAPL